MEMRQNNFNKVYHHGHDVRPSKKVYARVSTLGMDEPSTIRADRICIQMFHYVTLLKLPETILSLATKTLPVGCKAVCVHKHEVFLWGYLVSPGLHLWHQLCIWSRG